MLDDSFNSIQCIMGGKASVPMQRDMVELEAALNSTVPTVRAKLVCAELRLVPMSSPSAAEGRSVTSATKGSDGWQKTLKKLVSFPVQLLVRFGEFGIIPNSVIQFHEIPSQVR